jgi:hypothetical protein
LILPSGEDVIGGLFSMGLFLLQSAFVEAVSHPRNVK